MGIPQMPNVLAPPSLNALAREGYRPQKHTRGKTYGNRQQGGPKGNGWLGHQMRPDGAVMTEYSMGVDFGNGEIDIPTLVPTLTQQEMNTLLTHTPKDKMPESIRKKAIDHALKQMRQGLSPFFD